jgi:hypothetical protein
MVVGRSTSRPRQRGGRFRVDRAAGPSEIESQTPRQNDWYKSPSGWHLPERSEGRVSRSHHALRSSGRATRLVSLFLREPLRDPFFAACGCSGGLLWVETGPDEEMMEAREGDRAAWLRPRASRRLRHPPRPKAKRGDQPAKVATHAPGAGPGRAKLLSDGSSVRAPTRQFGGTVPIRRRSQPRTVQRPVLANNRPPLSGYLISVKPDTGARASRLNSAGSTMVEQAGRQSFSAFSRSTHSPCVRTHTPTEGITGP